MNASAESDGKLTRAAIDGDLAAFELLIQRFEDQLYRNALGILGSREDALDVVQETFISALGNLQQIRDPDSIGPWLKRAVHNRSLNIIRAETRRKDAYARYGETFNNVPHTPNYIDPDVQKLLLKLPKQSVTVFQLHYIDELSIKDIALRLGTTEASVKQRLYRVRRNLRKEILASVTKGDLPMSATGTTKKKATSMIENVIPILNVKDVQKSIKYYVEALGFVEKFHTDEYDFAGISRDNFPIYLSQVKQETPGTFIWVGVEDIEPLCEEFKANGAKFRQEPTNFLWAYEMSIEDPDGHVLRFGSEPK